MVEYTGGSTGTSLALLCAARGYRLEIVTSDAFSQEKRDHMADPDAAAGYHPMGEEIWEKLDGQVHAFVQAVGTAHSLHGVATVLRARNPDLSITVVEPAESPLLSAGTTGGHRIEGVGIGFLPPMWHPEDADAFETVTSMEAHDMARRLAREEAIFAGASTGANVVAALRVAQRLGANHTVVTIAVDSRLKYLATEVFAGMSAHVPTIDLPARPPTPAV